MTRFAAACALALALWAPPSFSAAPAPAEDWADIGPDPFQGGARAFEAAKKELLEHYAKEDLTEDALYKAALQGMLAAVDPKLRPYNRLLAPSEFAELNVQLQGEVVGIGVQFKMEPGSGRAEVLRVIPGSPAVRADLKEGDLILTIDGVALKGKEMADVVRMIRGEVGKKVTLGLLRDTAVIQRTLERQKVAFDVVDSQLLPGELLVLRIRSFVDPTPGAVQAALAQAAKAGAKGLIVDLRGNEGGKLDRAMDTAKLFLPKGRTVARMVTRGGKEEATVADGQPVLSVPTVVLVNGATSCAAELLAAALREGLKAPLLGTRTRGKWNAQSLKELPNRFVVKYTVAQLRDPNGKSWEGEGLTPDFEVPMAEDALQRLERLKTAEERVQADAQLRAASNFLRMR